LDCKEKLCLESLFGHHMEEIEDCFFVVIVGDFVVFVGVFVVIVGVFVVLSPFLLLFTFYESLLQLL